MNSRRKVVAGLMACMPLVALGAASASPSRAYADAVSPDCTPVAVLAHGAPQGDPLSMNADELSAAGFPPRPSGDLEALQNWERAVSAVTDFTVPNPVCGGPDHTLVSSLNAAGHVVSNSDFGGVHFSTVDSMWTQPGVQYVRC
jgi:hypothetical protein